MENKNYEGYLVALGKATGKVIVRAVIVFIALVVAVVALIFIF